MKLNSTQKARDSNTTIRVTKTTSDQLKKIGKKADTYDSVINELLRHVNECDRYWENKN